MLSDQGGHALRVGGRKVLEERLRLALRFIDELVAFSCNEGCYTSVGVRFIFPTLLAFIYGNGVGGILGVAVVVSSNKMSCISPAYPPGICHPGDHLLVAKSAM